MPPNTNPQTCRRDVFDQGFHFEPCWVYFSTCRRIAPYITGMRNDAPNESVVQRQAWRLAEISLEELAFVVMARAAACSGAGVEGEGDGSAHFTGVLNSAGTEAGEATTKYLAGWKQHPSLGFNCTILLRDTGPNEK